MPRQVSVEYIGAMYHVMSQGNRPQDIYLDDVNRPRKAIMRSPLFSPFATRFVAACISLGASLFLSCSSQSTGSGGTRGEALQNFMRVKEGMEEADVVQILGPPGEVRNGFIGGPFGQTHAFAYGASSPGAFARIGIVSFNASNRVIESVSPAIGYGIRQGADKLPKELDIAHPVSNVLCVIKGVTYEPTNPDYLLRHRVHFSLFNQSNAPYAIPTPLQSVQLCVVIEVYDENRRLFFRKDNGTMGPIASPGLGGSPSIVIGPGSSVEDETCIWLSRSVFGKPPPGVYYVRVAFGFDPFARNSNQFTISKAFRFDIP